MYLLSNVLNAAIPFALLPVLTRYLEPLEYGKVAIFLTLLNALAAFVGLSCAAAAARQYYDEQVTRDRIRQYMAACLQVLLATGMLMLAGAFAFRRNLESWIGLESKWILLAIFVSACMVVVQLRLSQWQVRGEAHRYGALQVSQTLFNTLLTLVLVVVLSHGAGGRIGAQVWSAALFAGVALILLKRDRLLSFRTWQPANIKDVLLFGVPLVPHIAGAFLLASVDRFVISAELGLAEAGIYMVAVQLAGAMAIIFDGINKAYVPWLFERLKRNQPHEKRAIVRYTYAWCLAIMVGAGIVFAVGPTLVPLFAGERYAAAGEVLGWLALGQGFGGMYLMVTNYAFYSKRTGLLSLATIVSGVINVSLLFLLIPSRGLEGAAIAFCLSMAVRVVLTWWVAQRCHPMPWFECRG